MRQVALSWVNRNRFLPEAGGISEEFFMLGIQRPITHNLEIPELLQQEFLRTYGTPARIYRSPCQVNLIGDHTDYNDGFVMPVAIGFYAWAAIAPRNDRKLKVRLQNSPEHAEIDLNSDRCRRNHWIDYVTGVATTLDRAQRLRGANLLIRSNVPIGSGLNSRAAVEVATGLALIENSGLHITRHNLTRLCRGDENEFIGARLGTTDRFASCCGQEGHAFVFDCRFFKHRALPLPHDLSIVICNPTVTPKLMRNNCYARRAECEEVVRLLASKLPQVRALRDLTLAELAVHARELSDVVYKRCRHVVTENFRVIESADAIKAQDLEGFGRLMYASHVSLRDDYEASSPQLNLLVELARQEKAVYGARMTGRGLNRCTITLVKNSAVREFKVRIAAAFQRATASLPQIFVSDAVGRAGEVLR